MKKIYLSVVLLAFASFCFAQSKVGGIINATNSSKQITKKTINASKAIGDTVMHFDGYNFFLSPADEALFAVLNEDLDGLPSNNAGWEGYRFFYSLDTAEFLHNDVDTANYFGATSWFNPAGTSNDWFSFGPITIPDSGALITWAVKWNPAYRDAYKVLVSTTGMDNYNDFTNPAIYSIADLYDQNFNDTLWAYQTVNIPSANNGQPVYISFQHEAVDMDVLWLDEISIIEANNPMSVNENNSSLVVFANMPNPANESTTISFSLKNSNNVYVNVYDITGRIVNSVNLGTKNSGKHTYKMNTSELSEGVYFYSINVGNTSKVNKLIVSR